MYRDYFGENADCLKDKRLFLFDMDGTIYEGEELFEGSLDLLDGIRKIGGKYVFITNNSSKSVWDYVEKVNRLGIMADEDNFFTSSQATILYLKENYAGKCIYCQGTKSLVKELVNEGLNIVTEYSDKAEVILIGYDTELTFKKIQDSCKMLQKDIPYIATNPDYACPVSFGFVPDCGSICMMYENATGRTPKFIGKPEPTMINFVREKTGYSKEETVVIGDRLYTDIASGLNADVTTICVLTGEATVEEILNGSTKPSYTFDSVKDISKIIASQMGVS